ncbi:ABC transporter substrate-binding protein [Bacillus horti]|uniref:Peptide/nickel transport system substrate-binding protein n=1 Tax=Caldalkalibacillus horti TaxID=77523 RepID=A0ABT9VY00_9BACI|nr:ABC transporter substrate-binding protein [Bacillus horti]MDQ0165856.1 peptide/nickel transport system substrate-binding protein [Bacillus horti]
MLRKNKWTFVLVAFLLLCAAACTPNTAGTDDQPDSEPGSETPDPSAPSRDSIVIAVESDAVTMLANTDVNYVNDVQIRNIYDPLIERDEQGQFIPGLAEEWESIDELTWEFKLRDDVVFHNGEPFNAEAVKFNIDYILDESNQSFYLSRWTMVDEVEVVDDYTVRIKTSVPFPTLPLRIADDLLIMEPTHVQEVGNEEAARNPIGTGAYEFDQWQRDEYLILTANDQYWKGEPQIKQVTFRYISEFSARLSAFLSGDVHLFKNVPVDSVANIENDDQSKIEMIGSSRINYLALNNFYEGPLQDQRVRQAINYAVDVDELLEAVLNGYGTKMTGPLSQINADYTETSDYGYDPDRAIELIQEAGYEPEDLNLQIDTPSGRYPMDTHVAQAIASQLERIGISVNIQVNEWGNHLAKIRQRDMQDMFILGWGPAYDGQGTIENLFTENSPYSGFYDPEVEEQIYAALPIFDENERKQAFDDLQHLLVEQAAWVPLWQQGDLYAVDDQLTFIPRVDERFTVFEMSWD